MRPFDSVSVIGCLLKGEHLRVQQIVNLIEDVIALFAEDALEIYKFAPELVTQLIASMRPARSGRHSLLLVLLHLARRGGLDNFARLLEWEVGPGGGAGSGRCDDFAVPAELLRR